MLLECIENRLGRPMNSTNLKVIAVVTMLIDHLGAVLFPEYLALRIVGRIAFPIYAFLLVEGYFHTRNVNKYMLRLGAFAVISEIPFDLTFFGTPFYWAYQNVFFTLLLGVMAMKTIDHFKYKNQMLGTILAGVLVIFSLGLSTDYSILGMLSILFFFYERENRFKAVAWVSVLHVVYALTNSGLFEGHFAIRGGLQMFVVVAMPLIYYYNGEKGRGMKYLFYAFYPVHLIVIATIAHFL